MSAILVKMPPAMRSAEAPSDSPMAKPMKQKPALFGSTKRRMVSITKSSMLISTVPMLIPALSGIAYVGKGLPLSDANAVRLFAKVLMRIPNQATPADPAMPMRLHTRISATLSKAMCRSTLK